MTADTTFGNDPVVGVIMGSDSDLPVMQGAIDALGEFGIDIEVRIISAHRTTETMVAYAKAAADRGLKVIIAGAGGAAHLPGMVASMTSLPVIGVPIGITSLQGLDSLLSIVQMPGGVPVATMAIDGARNAGLFAARILATSDPSLRSLIDTARGSMASAVVEKDRRVREEHL
ncbi:5-(carboxyamino)imidazole ribonucleotide mutase [soil metagenome]